MLWRSVRISKGYRIRLPDGIAPADVVRNRGFTGRSGAYFLDHDARSYELIARVFDGQSEGLTRDDILDNITITWLTNTAFWRPSLLGEQTRYFNAKGVSIRLP